MKQLHLTRFGIFTIAVAAFSAVVCQAQAQTAVELAFNPHNIIGDAEVLDHTAMTLDEVRNFLSLKGGFLSTFQTNSCLDTDLYNPTGVYKPCTGPVKTAAEIIYDRAITNRVNPKFLIVLLQKEGSLVELKTKPSQTRVDWAVGYGCPDSGGCSPRYQGFWRQINSASLQFRDYMENSQLYNYKPNQTYTVSNTGREPMVVTPQNLATAALYNYTPHVYNGNFNFFNIWQRYFPRITSTYPNGSLLQVEGEKGVWLIQNGKKRPFVSKGALSSRYDTSRILKTTATQLSTYVTGAPIKFPQYALVRSPSGGIFLLDGDSKRPITSGTSFKKLGFNPEEVVSASWDDINAYQNGTPITATSSYPTGTLLQDKTTGGIYWVQDNTKAPILDRIIIQTKFKGRKAAPVSSKELAAIPTTAPILFEDGQLLKSLTSTSVFVIADGQKHPIYSGTIFEKLGYKWENVITVSPKILYYYPQGEALKEPEAIAQPPLVSDQASADNSISKS
jgi:hypothetical protein